MTRISKSTIHRFANGKVSLTADILKVLAKGLKVCISAEKGVKFNRKG